MKKLLLFAFFLMATHHLDAQSMIPSKSVTKAIKKNPQLLNAINANPQLLNSFNLNENLLDAVVDEPQLLTLISSNPNILPLLNSSPDFLKLLTKKDDVLTAISLNPNIVNTLSSNPDLIKRLVKKPDLINTIAMSSAVASNNASTDANQAPQGQVVQNAVAVFPVEDKKENKKSTGNKVLMGALSVATGGFVGASSPLGLLGGKILSGNDIQSNIEKSKNKNVFLSKRFDEYVVEHKVVAILPFMVDIEGENKKQITSKKERVRNEKEIEEKIQESLYKFLLSHQDKYSIEFQDINNTVLKLKNSDIMSTLYTTPKEEIAKALGVDAVIAGSYVQKMANKESKSGTIKITLYDGKNGDWVWKLDENAGSKYSLIDETDKLMNSLMEKVVNFFPYRTASPAGKKR